MNIENDLVNHPSHYTAGKIEIIDFLEDQAATGLDFRLINTIKYITRARFKGKELEDLRKAIWYINRYMEKVLNIIKE